MCKSQLQSLNAAPKAGFALVIALSLMAFVILLLVSLTTFITVESRASTTNRSQELARQNAFLSLNIALGELQRTAGPDSRTTARADIFDSNPSTASTDGVANPLWLGVFKCIDDARPSLGLEDLRRWSTDRASVGQVDWLASHAGQNGGNFDPIDQGVGAAGSETLVIARVSDASGQPVDAEVGLLDIDDHNNSTAGRYGWWVVDENTKTRINITQPTEVLDGQPVDERWSLMSVQRSNAAIIPELSSFDPNDPEVVGKLERVFESKGLQMVTQDNSWRTWISESRDSYSLFSSSIPVDVTQGRLKQDLSVYLGSANSGILDGDNLIRGSLGDSDYSGRLTGMLDPADYNNLPKFGLLKSWYETGFDVSGFDGGTPPQPIPHALDSHGVHPVIMRTAVYFGLSFRVDASGSVFPVFLIYPKFILWNPHNVPIAPANYVIQVRAYTTLNTQINIGGTNYAFHNQTKDFNYEGNIPGFAHLNLANYGSPSSLQPDPDDGYPYLTFVINSEGFAPGETLLFTGDDKHPNSQYNNTDISWFESNASSINDHNILVNENNDALGFFYHSSIIPVTPLSGSAPASNTSTSESDILRSAFYFRNTNANVPVDGADQSLSTRLWHLSDSGSLTLLEDINLVDDPNNHTNTMIDWEHINTEGWSQQQYDPLTPVVDVLGLSQILNDPFKASWIRGHGYYMPDAAGVGGNRSRFLGRYAVNSAKKIRRDPIVPEANNGRMYADSIPSWEWFNGPAFGTEVPADSAYSSVTANGYDTPGGFGLYQFNYATPQSTVYPLYDYIRNESGLLSIGYLHNVGFSQSYWQPSFPFANSEAHTHIDRSQVKESHGNIDYIDLSYLLNESVFDRFFVSTIPQTGNFTPSTEITLPNSRHWIVPSPDGSIPTTSELRASETAFDQAAANIVVEGGFNVNSTSEDAWRLLLGSNLGVSVSSQDGSPSNQSDRVPLSSRAFPILSESALAADQPNVWSSLRSLTLEEIDLLSAAIVEEVKIRGPFLSLADFVNRRLIPNSSDRNTDYMGLKGTLQAAIDKTSQAAIDEPSALINNVFYRGALELDTSDAPKNSRYPEHELGVPEGEVSSRLFAAPAFLTQGDLLSSLAPLLTVRGDTFTIRAYGETLAATSSVVEASAWCEAIVQRVAETVDPSDSIVQPTGDFGRRFEIVSFRWLDQSEIP